MSKFNQNPSFLDREIERLNFVIDRIETKGENAMNEFDLKRGINKQQALEMLNNQLKYFKDKKNGS